MVVNLVEATHRFSNFKPKVLMGNKLLLNISRSVITPLLVSAVTCTSIYWCVAEDKASTQPVFKELFRHDYGDRGILVVKLMQSMVNRNVRELNYQFLLVPRGGGAPTLEVDKNTSDLKPIGAEPEELLLDAFVTSDSGIVTVFTVIGSDNNDQKKRIYFAEVEAPKDSRMWTYSANREVYLSAVNASLLKPSLVGSLKDQDLTLTLTGDKVALQFQFELHTKRGSGWYPAPEKKVASTSRPAAEKVDGARK